MCECVVIVRDPYVGPTLHDRPDRGQLHGPRAAQDRHLQRLVGTHRRRKDGGRTQERHHEGYRQGS